MLSPALQTLRASQDRVLEREGIPMVLALVSEIGPMPAVESDSVRAEGERLASAMDRFRNDLIPGMREEDNGCLISVLVATSYEDLDDAPVELPASAAVQPRKEMDA